MSVEVAELGSEALNSYSTTKLPAAEVPRRCQQKEKM